MKYGSTDNRKTTKNIKIMEDSDSISQSLQQTLKDRESPIPRGGRMSPALLAVKPDNIGKTNLFKPVKLRAVL